LNPQCIRSGVNFTRKGVVMFIRRRRDKIFVVQAVVYFVTLFLSINLLIMQMASGDDAVVDNHIGIPGDGRKPTHEEELPPYHSQHDSLRKRMEAERGYPRAQDEYLRYQAQRKDKNAGLENPGCLSSEEKVVGMSVEGAKAATATWAIEAVDAPKGFHTSSRVIAVDAGNHPHIAYGGDHLYYAYHDGAAWHYETADASFDVGGNASIALDTSGHAHISYHDNANRDLEYATNKSGAWVTTTVDSYGWVGFASSIAIDTSGHAHISYIDGINDTIKYATNASGSWVTATVVSVYLFYTSIAVDKSGNAQIS